MKTIPGSPTASGGIHTLFQISTSGALVAGVYQAAASTEVVLRHVDFGLGTFSGLDGEIVVVDGRAYRVRGDGTVSEAADDTEVPFAVVTSFAPDIEAKISATANLADLERLCDALRPSVNLVLCATTRRQVQFGQDARSVAATGA